MEMKKKLVMIILMAVILGMVAGCSAGSTGQIKTPVSNAQAGTPSPNGQISVGGVSIAVYAPGPNPTVNSADAHGRIAGIWMGIWHGFIAPVTLVLSIFNGNVEMYEVHNDGNLYNLGFFLGLALVFLILGIIFSSKR
jgi:hypothetical protein